MTLSLAPLLLGALLAGCGGGGGGGGGAPAAVTPPAPQPQQPQPQPEPPPPPPVMVQRCAGVETEDLGCLSNADYTERRNIIAARHRARTNFTAQWGLETINADKAWADVELLRGADAAPGSGVTVGFLDTGIDQEHPLFSSGSITETFIDLDPSPGVTRAANEDGSSSSHGTSVASIVGARPSGACRFRTASDCADFRGVAWGASLKMFPIRLGSGVSGRIYYPTTPSALNDANSYWAALYGRVLRPSENLDVLNLSFSIYGLIDGYTEAQLRANFAQPIAALAQADAERKTILVWSAGNANGDLCSPGSLHCVGSGRTGIDPRNQNPPNCLTTDPSTCARTAAGSLDARSPNVLAGMAARIRELRGHSVAVVSVNLDGAISSFSNRCGIAADWCVAAPGGGVRRAYFGPVCFIGGSTFLGNCNSAQIDAGGETRAARAVASGSGTSFAAPMVAGGLAVMRQVFRDQLSSEELLVRLFRTADKSGIYADRAIYGQGLMDLGAATNPVGGLSVVAGGGSVGDAGHPLADTRLAMGAPLGDGLSVALVGVELAAIDALGAPFWFDSSALTLAARGETSNERRLHGLTARRREARVERAGWRFGLYKSPVASESSLLNVAENAATVAYRTPGGLEASAFAATGLGHDASEAPDAGLALSWRPPDSAFGARLGWLREEETALGSKAGGAFGRLAADSLIAGVEAEAELGGWRLAAEVEAGFSRIHAGGGMIAGFSDVTTSSMALSARRRLSPGRELVFSVSQPPRVEGGRARLALPVGRTWSGEILRRFVSAGLAPSGRQIDFSARWRGADALGGELSLEAVWSRHPGHAAGEKREVGLLAAWRARW